MASKSELGLMARIRWSALRGRSQGWRRVGAGCAADSAAYLQPVLLQSVKRLGI